MRGCDGAWHLQFLLVEYEFERSDKTGFKCGQTDLAVALHGVAIPAGEICTGHEHRQIERGANQKLLVVQVAAEFARLNRTAESIVRRRRDRENSEKRTQRNGCAPR